MAPLKIPVGISDFKKLREDGYYYIDACQFFWYSKKARIFLPDFKSNLVQIDERMYAKEFEGNYDEIFCYGISFFKKRCMVKGIGK